MAADLADLLSITWSDPALSASATIDYYASVSVRTGAKGDQRLRAPLPGARLTSAHARTRRAVSL